MGAFVCVFAGVFSCGALRCRKIEVRDTVVLMFLFWWPVRRRSAWQRGKELAVAQGSHERLTNVRHPRQKFTRANPCRLPIELQCFAFWISVLRSHLPIFSNFAHLFC